MSRYPLFPISWFRRFHVVLALLAALLAWPSSASAAVLKNVQRGTASMTGASLAVTITSVDTTKSILFFSCTVNDDTTDGVMVGGTITNATTLTFSRTTAAPAVSIAWQVVEFTSGVLVQRGATNISASPTNVTLTTAVDLTKSFPVVTLRNTGVTVDTNDGVTASMINATTLRFAMAAAAGTAYWQVVQYDNCSVQQVSATLAGGSLSQTATIAAVTTGKTMIVGNHTNGASLMPSDMPRTELTNGTTITMTRLSTTGALSFVLYAVQFTDATTVTHGSMSFASGEVSKAATITAVNFSRSAVIGTGNFGRQGSSSYAADDNPGHGWLTYSLASATSVAMARAVGTGSTAVAPYQVVQFDRPPRMVSWQETNPGS